MKALILRLAGIGAMVVSFVLWMYGGAQIGFYKTFYLVDRFDEIMEVTYTEEVEAFLPGIETLAMGFVAFVVLLGMSAFIERKDTSVEA